MFKKKLLVILAVAAAAGIATFFAVHRSQAGTSSKAAPTKVAAPKSTFSLAAARAFDDFPVYNAGASIDGFPLVAVLRRNDGRTNYVSFIYGDCQPTGDSGCSPPAEVQVWPACLRNPSLYNSPYAPASTGTMVRGVPAALFGGQRLEIQTGASTVVIFGPTADEISLIARSLRGVNVPVRAQDRLPAPAPGALTGNLSCG
jgi:hypothetical protein